MFGWLHAVERTVFDVRVYDDGTNDGNGLIWVAFRSKYPFRVHAFPPVYIYFVCFPFRSSIFPTRKVPAAYTTLVLAATSGQLACYLS